MAFGCVGRKTMAAGHTDPSAGQKPIRESTRTQVGLHLMLVNL